MRKKTCIVVSTAFLMAMGTARADTGFFAVVNVGDSSADLDSFFLPLLSDDDRSFEIGGGYVFNRHLAVQAGYHDFGEFDGEIAACPPDTFCVSPPVIPFRVDVSGWSLRVTGSYPLGQRFAAFASVGVLVWDMDLQFMLGDNQAIFSSNRTEGDDAMYEAGLRWRLSDRWNLQASYEKVHLDLDSTKLGVLFRF